MTPGPGGTVASWFTSVSAVTGQDEASWSRQRSELRNRYSASGSAVARPVLRLLRRSAVPAVEISLIRGRFKRIQLQHRPALAAFPRLPTGRSRQRNKQGESASRRSRVTEDRYRGPAHLGQLPN